MGSPAGEKLLRQRVCPLEKPHHTSTKLICDYHTNTPGPCGHTSAPHLIWLLKRYTEGGNRQKGFILKAGLHLGPDCGL